MSEPLIIVDNSTLTAMATCPTQAAIRYALGLTTPDDRAPLRAGTLAHAVLAQHLSGVGGVAPLEIAEIATYIEFATGALEPTDRLYHENVIKVMRRWLDTHPVSGLPFRVYPELIEVGFAVPLADDVLFVGRLDGLVQDASGAWWVLEHKAQPLTAKVLTPTGFVEMGTLKVGDPIVGRDGGVYQVRAIYPRGQQDAYRVSLWDGGTTVCSGDHLWTVSDHKYDGFKTLPLKEMMAAPVYQKFHLPVLAPVAFMPTTVAPLDPYLVGALLGDGYLGGHSVQYSGSEADQIEQVRSALPPGDTMRKGAGRNYTWIIKGGATLAAVRAMQLDGTHAWDKFVPDRYKYGTVAERLAVLQGLLDTDGNVYEGHISYTSVSKRLVNDVVEMVRSLGGVARVRVRSGTKHVAWHVSIRLEHMTPFRLARKADALRLIARPETRTIRAIEPAGAVEMQCISVTASDGLYVTDDYIVTHNSTGRLDEIWRRRFKTSAQITGYVWAAQQHLKEPVSGCFVNGIEFGRLPTDVKKCRTHGVPYAECGTLHAKFDMLIEHRAPHQLEAWKADAIKLARRFRSLKEQIGSLEDVSEVAAMTGQFTNACGFCQFADYCAVGRPPATGRLMFNHEPWSPFDHAFQARS